MHLSSEWCAPGNSEEFPIGISKCWLPGAACPAGTTAFWSGMFMFTCLVGDDGQTLFAAFATPLCFTLHRLLPPHAQHMYDFDTVLPPHYHGTRRRHFHTSLGCRCRTGTVSLGSSLLLSQGSVLPQTPMLLPLIATSDTPALSRMQLTNQSTTK